MNDQSTMSLDSMLADIHKMCLKSPHPSIKVLPESVCSDVETGGVSFVIDFCRSILSQEHELFRATVGSTVKYPENYDISFTQHIPPATSATAGGSFEVLLQFARQHSVRLPEVILDIAKNLLEHARFSGPDLFLPNDATHVIAVLGSTDLVMDDWFVSDFCLLHSALGGTAKSERWLTSINPLDTIGITGRPIRHGPPDHMSSVFDIDSPVFYHLVDPQALASTFLSAIEDVASSLVEGERIIIILVSHGSQGGEVEIGTEYLTREDIESRLAFAREGVKITLISTACFSGIWLFPLPTSNTDVIAAASHGLAYSVPSSPLGCINGGNFTHALCDAFTDLAISRDSSLNGTNSEPTLINVTPEDIQPAQPSVRRAVSVKGIMQASVIDVPPTVSVRAWEKSSRENICRDMAVIFEPHDLNQESYPMFRFRNPDLPASMVLGVDKELSTLIRAEAILTLPHALEANLTSLALGIEEIVVHKSGDIASHAALVLQMMNYDRTLDPGLPIVPSNNTWLSKVRMGITHGRACSKDLREAYDILSARIKADKRAMFVARHYNPLFVEEHPIEHWYGSALPFDDSSRDLIEARELTVAFSDVLKHFLHEDSKYFTHRNPAYIYIRPRSYAIRAAIDCGLSPQELEERLKTLPQDTYRGS